MATIYRFVEASREYLAVTDKGLYLTLGQCDVADGSTLAVGDTVTCTLWSVYTMTWVWVGGGIKKV